MDYSRDIRIDWYRTPVERETMSDLMRRDNLKGWIQTVMHLGWFFTTGAIAYAVFQLIGSDTWIWSLPALCLALFLHGTMGPFMGLIAIHELQHRTVFKSRKLNEFFEKVGSVLLGRTR